LAIVFYEIGKVFDYFGHEYVGDLDLLLCI